MYYTVAASLMLLLFRSSNPSAFIIKPVSFSVKVITATPKPNESNNADINPDDPLATPSMFDLIVGTHFNSEADECREVGGDPWFLGQDEE
jgi:hypothetical protein